ncbi:MAG: hypothetical protein Q9182_002498 [Xanthomendoza sp. 2 TL-2023]
MPPPPKFLCGVVVSAGKMMKAVKVRSVKQIYDKFLRKHYTAYQSHLVSDPNSSLRTGDVVRIAARPPASKHLRHVVTQIVAPWGPPAEERPPIPTLEELDAQKKAKRKAKTARRSARRKASEGDGKAETPKDERPSLKERQTDVIAGPEVVGAEERVVLERGIADQG